MREGLPNNPDARSPRTSSEPIRIGVVGLGKMGVLHAGILNALPGSSVVSVTEKEGLLLKFVRKLLPDMRCYSRVEEMMSSEAELDAVYVTTPISSHRTIVEAVASGNRRMALFVEKPLAANYQDAVTVTQLSKGLGGCAMVGFQKRFSPIFLRGKRLLEEGILGELQSVEAYSYLSGVSTGAKGWRSKPGEGGALLDLGPHLIDMLVWYFGVPTVVDAKIGSIYSKGVDDYAMGELTFSSGLMGKFDVSWSKEGYRLPELGIDVYGSNGRMKVTDDYLMLDLKKGIRDVPSGQRTLMKPEFEMGVDFLIGDPEYCLEDKHFLECIRLGKEPEPGFFEGLWVNKVIEDISKAAGIATVEQV